MGADRHTSRVLSKTAWQVTKTEPLLRRLVFRGAVVAFVAALVLAVPGVALVAADGPTAVTVGGAVLIVVGVYFAVYVMQCYQAALVVAADAAMQGRPTTRQEAMAEARRHRGAIGVWAAITMTVGWLLSLISGNGDGDNIVLSIVRALVASTMAAAWSLLTLFVLPIVVFEDRGAGAALKRSAALFTQRWGTQLIGQFRIAIRVMLLFMLPGALLVGGGAVLAFAVSNTASLAGGIALFVVGLVLLVVGSVTQSALKGVFGVALYRYAVDGAAVGPFDTATLSQAVRGRSAGSQPTLSPRSAG